MSNKTCLALVALGLLAIVAACLLLFPAVQQQALLRALQSLVVDPTGSWDRDVSVWVGTVDPLVNLAGVPLANLAGLGFGGRIDAFNTPGEAPLPVSLGGLVGNAILVSALSPADGSADRFKIRSLTAGPATVVPVPAAAWLFVSAGGLLAAFRRTGTRPA